MTVLVGVVVDRVADPHRIASRARAVGNLFRAATAETEDVKMIGLAAAVTLLGTEVAGLRRVDHLAAARRVIAGTGLRHRQRLGRASVDRNCVQTRDAYRP